jgi:C-terminal processing protease CtpA/Prc
LRNARYGAADGTGGDKDAGWRITAGLDRLNRARPIVATGAVFLSLLALSGCGGGGSSGGSSGSSSNGNSTGLGSSGGTSIGGTGWIAGVYQPSSRYAAHCASPRVGVDPITGQAYSDLQGSTLDENNWLRSWTNELYLWYREVPDLNPAQYSTTEAYFDLLKTSAVTSTGNPKDKFHFTLPTTEWESESQAGSDVGYGVQWVLLASRPPRDVVVAYITPGYSAAAAGIGRGAQVLAIDGVDMINADDQTSVDTLNAGLSPSTAGETHTFTIQDPGSSTSRTVTLQAQQVTEKPVAAMEVIGGVSDQVGYILFNDHIATAEQELIDAVNSLRTSQVTDLILDIRYNGGGYLDIASELAYMIAGPAPTTGQTFELQTFNDKYPSTNPLTGAAITPVPFHDTSQGFSTTTPAGTALPTLNLSRVFVITGAGTCSASEAIINSLRGVGVSVIQIGSTTCGKPYGFYPQDNCGTTYFSIEFQGDNAAGFGDYPDGFTPVNSTTAASVSLPGCSVADDFSHQLGDPAEGRLAATLQYRSFGLCPTPPSGIANPTAAAKARAADGIAIKSTWRRNRIFRAQGRAP